MTIKFRNDYLEKLFQNRPVPGKPKFSKEVITKFQKTVLKLQFADNIRELRMQRGLNFEALKGNLKGFYSVRVDSGYRLIISLEKDGSLQVNDIIFIEDLTNHYR